MYLIAQLAWVAVPVFFVLSGYLITGILYDSRHREGFFRVFYQRRAIRILPLYYAVVALYALISALFHWYIPSQQIAFLVYLQNLPNLPESIWSTRYTTLSPLWSLAVEEQFYLLWPVVIWFIPHRKPLLRVCYAAIAVSTATRFIWSLIHFDFDMLYRNTLTRGDAIILGAALALHSRKAGFKMARLARPAAWVMVFCLAAIYARVHARGTSLPLDYIGVSCMIPVMNLFAAAIIVLTLTPGSVWNRACRSPRICRLGSMSYSLYVVHLLPVIWFHLDVAPWLAVRIGHPASRFVVLTSAGAFTYFTAKLCHQWFELPAIRLKDRFRYGPQIPRRHSEDSEPIISLPEVITREQEAA